MRKSNKTAERCTDAASYAMMAPWLLFFLLFTVIPIGLSFMFSFTGFNMLQAPRPVGLSNYLRLFLEDDVFLTALKNTILFALITGPVGYLLSFAVAWMINDCGKIARPLLTLLFYSPSLAGNVYFIWIYIFNGDSYGALNGLLLRFGLLHEPVQWLTDTRTSFAVCVVVLLWLSMGAGFLAFLAGFRSLDRSLFEAAAIDGIRNRFQEMWYVTLPQMIPQLLIGAVLSVSGAFATGYQNMVLTGFPSTDYSTHTWVLHILDHGYYRFEMGYACASAVLLFAVMLCSWRLIERALSRIGT